MLAVVLELEDAAAAVVFADYSRRGSTATLRFARERGAFRIRFARLGTHRGHAARERAQEHRMPDRFIDRRVHRDAVVAGLVAIADRAHAHHVARDRVFQPGIAGIVSTMPVARIT